VDDAEPESEIAIPDEEVPLIDLPPIEEDEKDVFPSPLTFAIIIIAMLIIAGAIILVIRKKRSKEK